MASKNVREHEARPSRINNEFHLDPNTKRFKQTLIYFNTDTRYANFRGNPLYQVT